MDRSETFTMSCQVLLPKHYEDLMEDFTRAAVYWFNRIFVPAVARNICDISSWTCHVTSVQNRSFDDFAGTYSAKKIIAKACLIFGTDYWPSVVLEVGPQSQYGRMLDNSRTWLMGGHSSADRSSLTGTVNLVLIMVFTFHTEQGLQGNLKQCILETWRRRRPSDGSDPGANSESSRGPQIWLQSSEELIRVGPLEDNNPNSEDLRIEIFGNTLGITLANLFGELLVPDQLTRQGLDAKTAISFPLDPLANSIKDAQIQANEDSETSPVRRRRNTAFQEEDDIERI